MQGTKFYKIVIVLLIVINIATLSFMWFGKPPHPPKPGDGPKLSEMIGLQGDSKLKVDSLEKNHHKEKKTLMEKDAKLHLSLFNSVGSEAYPSETLDQLNENKQEIEIMTFKFFNDVSGYCDADQIKELKKFIERAMMDVNRRPGPPKK